MTKKYNKDQVVAELAKRFPDADTGPAGLWGFVNAGWEGDVDDRGMDNWEAAWSEAIADTERDNVPSEASEVE